MIDRLLGGRIRFQVMRKGMIVGLVLVAIMGCTMDHEEEGEDDALPGPCLADGDEAGWPAAGPLGLTPSKTINDKYRVWPNGRIPYKIDGSVGSTTLTRLMAAMNDWETKTGQLVYFEPAVASDTAYLLVLGDPAPVTSHVGYKKDTVTKVKLRNPEYTTVIRHELGHVLGLHHEQRRSDRDGYIKVNSGNVVSSAFCKPQFSVCADCLPILDYNVKSVMHYRSSDLKSCRVDAAKPILLAKDGTPINHEWVLTNGDLAAIDVLYGGAGGGGAGGGSSSGAGGAGTGGNGEGGDDSLPSEGIEDGSGGAGGSGGTLPGGGGEAGAAGGGSSGDASGGCTCRAAEGRTSEGALAAALALIALGYRRRGRRTRAPSQPMWR